MSGQPEGDEAPAQGVTPRAAAGTEAAGVTGPDAVAPPAGDAEAALDDPRLEAKEGEPAGAPAAGDEPAPAAEVTEEHLRLAEALLFATDRPVAPSRLALLLGEGPSPHAVLAALSERYAARGVQVVEVAGGFAFRTAPDLASRLTKVVDAPRRLPRAAMEALAIIAYHQPCTRTEIEEIRGASLAQSTLETLLEMGLVQPRGRRETPGRPTLWGTTSKFLEQFGLKALSDLPRKEELVSDVTPQLPLHARSEPPAGQAPAANTGEDAPGEPPRPDLA